MSETATIQSTILEEAEHIRDMLLPPDAGLPVLPEADRCVMDIQPIMAPMALKSAVAPTHIGQETVSTARERIGNIIDGTDDRALVVCGPCSMHDPEAALEYAAWLKGMRDAYGADLEIAMRAYPEKPRSITGWKGLAYDPGLDDSNDMSLGLVASRLTMREIVEMDVPVAAEQLSPLVSGFLDDLVAYGAIGARNAEDQNLRMLASGMSMPVGIKNTTAGSTARAVEGIQAVRSRHTCLEVSAEGTLRQVTTTGNSHAHLILRGGEKGPNYSAQHVEHAARDLAAAGLQQAIMIDASHGNSSKDHRKQIEVVKDVASQLHLGQMAIKGVMIESNLVAGAQKMGGELTYGQSITDGCVDLQETEAMLELLAGGVRARRAYQ